MHELHARQVQYGGVIFNVHGVRSGEVPRERGCNDMLSMREGEALCVKRRLGMRGLQVRSAG